jgi:hypothetical protein
MMFPLISIACLFVGTFILLSRLLLLGVQEVVVRPHVRPFDDRH